MVENEIIIVNGISDIEYNSIIQECVEYAIISLPFTVNRMSISNETQRALNIAKGKLAEALFRKFCAKNNIPANFDICSTPFWTVDNRDFVLHNKEWDIKNNYIYYPKDIFNFNFVDLPALVPNRFEGDQWSKRTQNLIAESKGVCFLFTYLKNADLINGKRSTDFLEIKLSEYQQTFLRSLYQQYKGKPQANEPYTSQWFWEKMEANGNNQYFVLHTRPELIITGYADDHHWKLFENTGVLDRNNHLQNAVKLKWYTKSPKGSCNFLNGTLWTTITNATTPVASIPAFLSLFPKLKAEIKAARIKK
jgi:hypothetical protein